MPPFRRLLRWALLAAAAAALYAQPQSSRETLFHKRFTDFLNGLRRYIDFRLQFVCQGSTLIVSNL